MVLVKARLDIIKYVMNWRDLAKAMNLAGDELKRIALAIGGSIEASKHGWYDFWFVGVSAEWEDGALIWIDEPGGPETAITAFSAYAATVTASLMFAYCFLSFPTWIWESFDWSNASSIWTDEYWDWDNLLPGPCG